MNQKNPSGKSRMSVLIMKTWIDSARLEGIGRITVQQLCRKIPVSRSSFYEHFSSLADLQETVRESFFLDLLSADVSGWFLSSLCSSTSEAEYVLFFTNVLNCLRRNRNLLMLLLSEQPDDIFKDRWRLLIEHHLSLRFPEDSARQKLRLIRQAIPDSMIALYRSWLTAPDEDPADTALAITRMVFGLEHMFRPSI